MQEKKNRSVALDVAKGVGILLVVLGHSHLAELGNEKAWRVIFSFHMPLFFLLSGLVLSAHDKTFGGYLAARAHGLLKPYAVVLLGVVLVGLALARWRGLGGTPPLDQLLAILQGTGPSIRLIDPTWTPLWYLPHVFLVLVVCWMLVKYVPRAADAWWLPALLLAAGVAAMSVNQVLPWSADLLPVTTAYVLVGYQLRDRWRDPTLYRPWIVALALVAFVACHVLWDDYVDLNMRRYGHWALSTVQQALGIYLMLGLGHYVASLPNGRVRRTIAYVGSGTLFVLLFHAICQGKAWGAMNKLGAPAGLAVVISAVAAVALPLMLWELAKRSRLLRALLLPPAKP